MKFPGARYGLKMACGENPKRVYGQRNQSPATRMGSMAGYRSAFILAEPYRRPLGYLECGPEGRPPRADPPPRDPRGSAARQYLRAEPLLSRRRDGADARPRTRVRFQDSVIPSRDRGLQGALICCRRRARRQLDLGRLVRLQGRGDRRHPPEPRPVPAGRCARHRCTRIIPAVIQRLNQEAAKAMYAGHHAGIQVTRDQALRWITANPAWALGIDGSHGDARTWQDGRRRGLVRRSLLRIQRKRCRSTTTGWLVYDRHDAARQHRSDFGTWSPDPGGRSMIALLLFCGCCHVYGASPDDRDHGSDGVSRCPGPKLDSGDRVDARWAGSWLSERAWSFRRGRTRIDGTDLWVTPGLLHSGPASASCCSTAAARRRSRRTPPRVRSRRRSTWRKGSTPRP